MADAARRQARELDAELAAGRDRGPLHGVPITIKDILDIRGVPTTAASRVREGHVAERDCQAVAHLRQAGAIFVGKTNLHEFAFGTTNEDSAFGPARNPHDATRSPGGSSGGSGSEPRRGRGDYATIGTDTGGSIRIPAGACGLVGLKPTLGEVSVEGVVPLSRTMDHVGPLAHSVADACLVYHALLGDPTKRPPAPLPMHGLRLAVLRPYFCDLLDDEVRGSFERALERLRHAGAHVDDIEIRHAADIGPVYLHLVLSDAAAYHAATLETMPERYTPAGAAPARNGPLHSGGRLRAGARRTGGADARSGRGAGPARRARAADAADSRADDRRRDGRDRRTAGTGPKRDAPADAALRRHGASGDLDSVGADQGRAAPSASSSSEGVTRPTRCCASRWPANATLPPRSSNASRSFKASALRSVARTEGEPSGEPTSLG